MWESTWVGAPRLVWRNAILRRGGPWNPTLSFQYQLLGRSPYGDTERLAGDAAVLAMSAPTAQSARVPPASPTDFDEYARRHSEAFPSEVRKLANDLIRTFPVPDGWHEAVFRVMSGGEELAIPYRIYNPEPTVAEWGEESTVAHVIRLCFYSRHNDGFVRQRAVRGLLSRHEAWVAPFVVQLVGEYVFEIIDDIHRGLDLRAGSETSKTYGRFAADNKAFIALTSRRVTSYWNCYYRSQYPVMRPAANGGFAIYPGFKLVEALRAAADSCSG